MAPKAKQPDETEKWTGHAIDAERALLASAWLSQDAEILKRLHENDFTGDFERWLFNKLLAVVESGLPLDMVAVWRLVKAKGGCEGLPQWAEDQLAAHVAELLRDCPTTAHKEYYFTVLRTERLRRASLALCDKATRKLSGGEEPRDVLEWTQTSISQLTAKSRVG